MDTDIDSTELQRQLTKREQQCLRGVAGGLVSAEIAKQLQIHERTVEGHIANILRKMSCKTRSQAVAHAFRQGILK
ncbi:MAG: helix-turn-helix transcriptional regulator [Pseudomonadota bacterium]